LQPPRNNDLHKFPSERRKGIVGTTIIHLVLFVLLVIVGFSVPPPPEMEEGILVNFGTDETGLGLIEPSPPVSEVETSPPQPVTPSVKQEEDPLLTQNFEEAPEVKKADPEAEKKKLEKLEADKKLKEQIEAERIRKEQEEIERKRVEAEQKRQTEIMNRTKNALSNSKNAGTNSTAEGIAGGIGNQGVVSGSVDSKVRGDGSGLGDKGISYNLQGRGFQSLPPPKYDYQGEGRVVVEVSVDRIGKVIQAIPGTKGSTTLDEYLLKVAKEAAMDARFEIKQDAPLVQKGTITYNFILR
jgi:colicin import membrane protein